MSATVVDATLEDLQTQGFCGYKRAATPGFKEKIAWLDKAFAQGLRVKMLLSSENKLQGSIEYLPGEVCWRPVSAKGYLFIHCIFILSKQFKQKGHGSQLLRACLDDAERNSFDGVAIVTRKGSFMAGNQLFLNNGFKAVDTATPDFELLARPLNEKAAMPAFNPQAKTQTHDYGDGLVILRSDQCPYSVKNVEEIADFAEKELHLKARVISLRTHLEAQQVPNAFGTFTILYNGGVIAHHPISKTRFSNIMSKL